METSLGRTRVPADSEAHLRNAPETATTCPVLHAPVFGPQWLDAGNENVTGSRELDSNPKTM